MKNFARLWFTALAFLTIIHAAACPAGAWLYQRHASATQAVKAVAEDPNGDIIAAIIDDDAHHQYEFLAMVKLDGQTGAEIWFREFFFYPTILHPAPAFAIDAAGDVIVVSTLDAKFKAVKLDGGTGKTIWDTPISPVEYYLDQGRAVALEANGDVIAGGNLSHDNGDTDYMALRLDGATGNEIWRREFFTPGEMNTLVALAVDSAGDVYEGGGSNNAKLVKLSGATGVELWRLELGSGGVTHLAIDGGDNVIAAGNFLSNDTTLMKLSSAGDPVWSRTDPYFISSMALTPSNDVIVGGRVEFTDVNGTTFTMHVAKHAGTNGSPLWTRSIDDALANAVSVEPSSGDAFAAGALSPVVGKSFDVFRFAATNGNTVWHRTLNGVLGGGEAFAISPKSDGKAIAGGTLKNPHSGQDAAVFVGEGDGSNRQSGNTFNFKIGEVFAKKWLWGISAALPFMAAPSRGGLGDLSREGARLELSNPTTRESAIIDLPGTGWTALGRVYAAEGFKYLDPDHSSGPCHRVLFKPGKKLTVSCKIVGDVHPISLDERVQGSFDVKLRFGNGDVYCFSTAGGEVKKDLGIAAPRQRGVFHAVDAPAPATCE